MIRADLLDRLADAEWAVSQGARRIAEQRGALRQLRSCMRDVTDAQELLIDLECEQMLSVNERDLLREQLEESTHISKGQVRTDEIALVLHAPT
jgi:hypothetical protein